MRMVNRYLNMWVLFVLLSGPPKFGGTFTLKILNDLKPLFRQSLPVVGRGGRFENNFALRKVAKILFYFVFWTEAIPLCNSNFYRCITVQNTT